MLDDVPDEQDTPAVYFQRLPQLTSDTIKILGM